MTRYALSLLAAVIALPLLLGSCAHTGWGPQPKKNIVRSVTLEIILKQEAPSKEAEGGGALETIDLMKVIQRVNIGQEFTDRDEKRVTYTEKESGVDVPVTGRQAFVLTGKTIPYDDYQFSLNMELQYVDDKEKINFQVKPSVLLYYESGDETLVARSGSFRVMLRVSSPTLLPASEPEK
jgi:hypothetical protein